jgi:hypothetical protein
VDFLRHDENMNKPLAEARLIVSGRDVAMVREGELVSVLSRPGQSYLKFVVDLPQVLGDLVNVADAAKTFAHGIASTDPTAGVAKKQPTSVASPGSRPKVQSR